MLEETCRRGALEWSGTSDSPDHRGNQGTTDKPHRRNARAQAGKSEPDRSARRPADKSGPGRDNPLLSFRRDRHRCCRVAPLLRLDTAAFLRQGRHPGWQARRTAPAASAYTRRRRRLLWLQQAQARVRAVVTMLETSSCFLLVLADGASMRPLVITYRPEWASENKGRRNAARGRRPRMVGKTCKGT